MSLSTYADLQAAVGRFARRTDLTADIPTFIALCEAQISRTLRVRRMVKRLAISISSEFLTLPADFAGAISLQLTDAPCLDAVEYIAASTLATMKQAQPCPPSRPSHFSVVGSEFEFYPAPSSAVNASLIYYATVPALSDAAPTNWLLTAWPDLYLYGSLMHTAPYMADDERLPVWAGLYGQAFAGAQQADARDATSGLRGQRPTFTP